MRHRLLGSGVLTAIMIAVVACGGGGASTAPSEAASSAPSSEPTVAPTSAAPSAASEAPSEAPSASASEAAIPSFAFPSTDKELEALLPDTLCGAKVQKLSMGGQAFAANSDPSFVAILKSIGKSPADVSLAIAAPLSTTAKCTAGIFRIKGADGGALKDAFLAQATKEGNTYTVSSISGKDVYSDPTSDSIGYAYFKGDAIIFASADSAKDAASVIAVLP